MKKETAILRSALILGLCAPSAFADWSRIPSTDFSVKDPPQIGSQEYKDDFTQLLREQASDREADCALARSQKIPKFPFFFANSGILSQEEFSAAEPFMKEVDSFVDKVTRVFKDEFQRPRPINADDRIEPCADTPKGATSYPSAHSAISFVEGCALGALYPGRAARLKEYSLHLGDIRHISGVHHPSDVAAGQQLGADICERLLQEDDFKEAMAEARVGK